MTPITRRHFVSWAAAAGTAATLPPGVRGASTSSAEICFTPARELLAMIRQRQISCREVMQAFLRQIAAVNPKVNAIVGKLDDAQCLQLAAAADDQLARGPVGPLHGLPFAFKDLEPAAGLRFTSGSPIFKDRIATEDSVGIERIRRAGAIAIGKTNTPEFGLGSHTYNKVYGTTYNPYDLRRSAGGSSGGAAAALATGMLALANGSDMGGSLRNPANFDNVVGLRPTVGLVPTAPTSWPYAGLAVRGPMARNVADLALLLSVMAGSDPRDPAAYPSDPTLFTRPLERELRGLRVAWCPDLGGLPLDPRVRHVLEARRQTFVDLGCIVENAAPELAEADEVFLTLRAFYQHANLSALAAKYPDQFKPEALREVELGAKLTGPEVSHALNKQAQIMERMRQFQEKYEFTLCAVNQIPPFDAALDWPKEIDGHKMDHYISWMKSAYWITVTQRPAISVPAGFTSDGLPVGIQIVGRYRQDFELLRFAHMYERATNFASRRPAIVA